MPISSKSAHNDNFENSLFFLKIVLQIVIGAEQNKQCFTLIVQIDRSLVNLLPYMLFIDFVKGFFYAS